MLSNTNRDFTEGMIRETTDQSCHGVLQRHANKLSSEYRWQYSFAAAVGAKPCRIRRGTAIQQSPQRPGTTLLPYRCHTIAIHRQWYNCHTIAIPLLWQSPQQSLVYVLRHTPHGGNPHIPLLLDPKNLISRRHGKTHGSGTIYVPNVYFTTAPEGRGAVPPLLFLGGSPFFQWQQNAIIFHFFMSTFFD